MSAGARGQWTKTPRAIRGSIGRAVDTGVLAGAVAFFARWWQLETWLRQLVYTELRAKFGTGWLLHLAQQAPTRAARDEINKYMATPDSSNVLAYLDVSDLFDLIGNQSHWPLFEPSLLPRTRWDGVVEELRELRNRNAHCRRPHHLLREMRANVVRFECHPRAPLEVTQGLFDSRAAGSARSMRMRAA